jgi:hypothetical protein
MRSSLFPSCTFTEHNQIVTLEKEGSNIVWDSGDSKAILRIKFVALFVFQMVTGLLFRLEYRLLDVITGKSLIRGIKKGRRAFQAEALEKMLKKEQIPHYKTAKNGAIAKAALIEVAISVTKCVLYPLALIALQGALVVGFIAPYTGRYVYGFIEKKFAVGDFETTGCGGAFVLTNFSAPCMQSDDVWDKRNLFRHLIGNDLGKMRNIALIFENYTADYAAYFTDSRKEALKEMRAYRKTIEEKSLYEEGIGIFRGKLSYCKDAISAIDKKVEEFHIKGIDTEQNVSRLQKYLLDKLKEKILITDN